MKLKITFYEAEVLYKLLYLFTIPKPEDNVFMKVLKELINEVLERLNKPIFTEGQLDKKVSFKITKAEAMMIKLILLNMKAVDQNVFANVVRIDLIQAIDKVYPD